MMPDFSLQEAPRRVAVAGEILVTYRFRSGSIGLASPLEMAAKGVRCKIGGRRSWWSPGGFGWTAAGGPTKPRRFGSPAERAFGSSRFQRDTAGVRRGATGGS